MAAGTCSDLIPAASIEGRLRYFRMRFGCASARPALLSWLRSGSTLLSQTSPPLWCTRTAACGGFGEELIRIRPTGRRSPVATRRDSSDHMSDVTTPGVDTDADYDDTITEATAVIDNGSFGTRTIRFETGRLA